MRMSSNLGVVFAGIILCGFTITSAHAQTQAPLVVPVQSPCTNGTYSELGCKGHGCVGTYASSNSGSQFQNNSATSACCGQSVSVAGTDDIACTGAALETPKSREVLATLTNAGVQILVKSCQGHFVAYVIANPAAKKPFEKMQQMTFSPSTGGL